jgi:hypothetical protein
MLKKVRLAWIDGVLEQSLFKEARIALDLAEREGAVQRPYEVVRRGPVSKTVHCPTLAYRRKSVEAIPSTGISEERRRHVFAASVDIRVKPGPEPFIRANRCHVGWGG